MPGTADKQAILQKLSEILYRHATPEQVDVYLFGSWAKGTEKRTSDIDLAIYSKTNLSPAFLPILKEEFEESTIPYRVELVDLRTVSEDFAQNVLKEGIRWTDWNNV